MAAVIVGVFFDLDTVAAARLLGISPGSLSMSSGSPRTTARWS
jgi:hypothetical protein